MTYVILNGLLFFYNLTVKILGNAGLIILFIYIIWKIRQSIVMKISTKKFAKELAKVNFINESIGKQTEEEKNIMKTSTGMETKITLNFGDMSVKKEVKEKK